MHKNTKYSTIPATFLSDVHQLQSVNKLCQKYNVTHSVIKRWLKQCNLNIIPSNKPYILPSKEEFETKVKTSQYIYELVDFFNIPRGKIYDCSKRYNIDISHLILKKETLPIPDKDILLKQLNEHSSKIAVGKLYNTHIGTVDKWLKHHNINLIPYYGTKYDLPETFVDEFKDPNITLTYLKEKYNVTRPALIRWIRENNISFVGKTTKKPRPSKEELLYYNYDQKLTSFDMAKIYNVSDTTITQWFREYNLDIKSYRKNESKAEKEIIEYVNSFGFNFNKTKRILNLNYELDGYDETTNIAIEYCGLYWHSEAMNKHKNYHFQKWKECYEKNITLLTIFENEWMYKQEIVKSILSTKLGKNTNKIYARKCEIKEIKHIKQFYEHNHIQGHVNSSINLGLFYENELVCALSFSKPRFNKHYQFEITRFCNKLYTNVVGGFSKLFSYFIKQYNPESILTYADLRYSNGELYRNNGFKYLGLSPPNYWYTKEYNLESRVKYQKHKLQKILPVFDPTLSEKENMLNNKFNIIWDCGNAKYEWKRGQ